MATNDKHQLVTKRIYGGNLGKQLKLQRQLREIELFETYCSDNIIEINVVQQTHIDSVRAEVYQYDNQVRLLLNETALEDMITEEVVN